MRQSPLCVVAVTAVLLLSLASVCRAGMDLTNYVLTWDQVNTETKRSTQPVTPPSAVPLTSCVCLLWPPCGLQDFTKLSSLSVTANGPCGKNGSTWMAHTPYYGDWARFLDPTADFEPFHLANGGPLTIRAQREGNTDDLYCGLLASVDPQGRGFAQRYGYFEMRAQLPSGLGTWPAFCQQRCCASDAWQHRLLAADADYALYSVFGWSGLEDVTGLVDPSKGHHEIDVLESYGNNVGILHTTQHWWPGTNDTDPHWANWSSAAVCSMQSGMHTYGIDIQPDSLTYYYDRTMIWQATSAIPNHGTYDRPLYIMVNLAYGGGGDSNNVSYILDNPQSMLVDYVRVWQGSGGSARASDVSDATALGWWGWPPQFALPMGQPVNISGVSLLLQPDGRLAVINTQQRVLYMTDIAAHSCNASCEAVFQNDGNLVLRDAQNVYWSAGTWGRNAAILTLQNEPPYLLIQDSQCNVVWTTANKTQSLQPSLQQHQQSAQQ